MKPFFSGVLEWKPKDIYEISNKNVLNSVQNTKNLALDIKNTNGQLVSYMFLSMATILYKIL